MAIIWEKGGDDAAKGDDASLPDESTVPLCQVAAELTDLTGAAITLLSGTGSQLRMCVSDEVAATIEELHFTLGEGPCLDAFRQDRPVLEPDLAHPTTARWIGFTTPAVRAGVRALFAFPVHIGASRVGVLSLYRDKPGPLTEIQQADALVMADVAGDAVSEMQANSPADAVPLELVAGVEVRAVVHRAAGMMSVQLAVSVAQALVRLRTYAFVEDRALVAVAADVVARELLFDPAA